MFIKKSYYEGQTRCRKVKKEDSKTWSEEAIDSLIKCFQSHECIWNVTGGDHKDQNRNSLPLEEFNMSVQEYNINGYNYKNMEYSPRLILTIFVKNAPPQTFNLVLDTPQTYHSEPSRMFITELFCKNSERLIAINYFCKKAPPQTFDWVSKYVSLQYCQKNQTWLKKCGYRKK